MGKWLNQLEKFVDTYKKAPTKPTEDPFVSSVGSSIEDIEKNRTGREEILRRGIATSESYDDLNRVCLQIDAAHLAGELAMEQVEILANLATQRGASFNPEAGKKDTLSDLRGLVRITPKKVLLEILRASGPEGVSSLDLIEQYGYGDDLEISIYAKELLADGEPVGFSCEEGHWSSLSCSDAPLRLWYADTPEENWTRSRRCW